MLSRPRSKIFQMLYRAEVLEACMSSFNKQSTGMFASVYPLGQREHQEHLDVMGRGFLISSDTGHTLWSLVQEPFQSRSQPNPGLSALGKGGCACLGTTQPAPGTGGKGGWDLQTAGPNKWLLFEVLGKNVC